MSDLHPYGSTASSPALFSSPGTKTSSPADYYRQVGDNDYTVNKDDPLDDERHKYLHSRHMGNYMHELSVQYENRAQMEIDEAFRDHKQWTDEEIAELLKRGQDPLVYNIISTSTNWLIGTQRRTRFDRRILPRNKANAKAAAHKSEILKMISDASHFSMHQSEAFKEQICAGVSFLEGGSQSPDLGEVVMERHETWRNVVWDSAAREMDLSDGRYIYRHKWCDADVIAHMFPHRIHVIDGATADSWFSTTGFSLEGDLPMDSHEASHTQGFSQWGGVNSLYGHSRPRLRVIEGWFRAPARSDFMRGGQFAGELFDPYSQGHVNEINSGAATVSQSAMRMTMHVALMTTSGLLSVSKTPYRHNRFPLTPVWCYRRASDLAPYGIIRGLRDPQRDLNKRAAKSLFILNTKRALIPTGSVTDVENFRSELSRPDSILQYDAAAGRPEIETDLAEAAAQQDLMSRDIMMIQQTGGITDENLGRQTNASSGIAITARQDQGALATTQIFDNFRFGCRIHGEKQLINVEQFMSMARQMRITNDAGRPDWINVNDGTEENSITRSKADFVVSEQDAHDTLRQAKVQQLFELLQQIAPVAPQVTLSILDLLVEQMDLPQGDEIVKRLRSDLGIIDPEADPSNPDPDTAKIMASKDAQSKMQQRRAEAEVAKIEATAAELMARARKTNSEADAREAARVSEELAKLGTAITMAIELLQNPGAAVTADHLVNTATARAMPSPSSTTPVAPAIQEPAMQEQEAPMQEQMEPNPSMPPQPTM